MRFSRATAGRAVAAICVVSTSMAVGAPRTPWTLSKASADSPAAHGEGAVPPTTRFPAPLGLGALTSVVPLAGVVPTPISMDLTAWAPPAGDQQTVNSCVSWSIDYTLMGWYQRRYNLAGFPLAPMYTYSQLAQGRNVATAWADTFPIATSQGV